MMIFEATPDQVRKLSCQSLVELLKRLMLAECRRLGLPLRAATVPLQITVADGGEDARVEWAGKATSTDYFPASFTILQSKAQNLTETTVRTEVTTAAGVGKRRLNDAIMTVLRHRGAYVVFCSEPFGGQKIDKLIKKIRSTIEEFGELIPAEVVIQVYDGNRIANWATAHPSVALWLNETLRGRSLDGFQSQDSWAKSIAGHAWVDDDQSRFKLEGGDISSRDDGNRGEGTCGFNRAATNIRGHLSREIAAVRIAGPSGYGKTRFAFEMLNGRREDADAIDSAALIYADVNIVGDGVARLALELSGASAPTLFVVDECDDALHAVLVEITQRQGSQLRLVTIDIETAAAPSTDMLVVRLEAMSGTAVRAVAREVAPALSDAALRVIEDLAQGFPRMAVLAAKQGGVGQGTIRSAAEILTRVVWGARRPDNEAQKALQIASMFEWIGIDGPVVHEAEIVAQHLAEMSTPAFVAHVRSFLARGVVLSRGNYIQVSPVPIAASLAGQLLTLMTQTAIDEFFAAASERLKLSLLARLRWLDLLPQAKSFATRLLAPTALGNLKQLSSELGIQCVDRLVHLVPDEVMALLERVLGPLDAADLHALSETRRELVWALERLVFRHETFVAAATLLRRLAVAETEHDISNNATGQFLQLFQMLLAGTEAGPSLRLLVLDEGLRSNDERERAVCVSALDRMLRTGSFTRSGRSGEIGGGAPLQDWRPATPSEARAYHGEAADRLVHLALSAGAHQSRAMRIIATGVRELIDALPLAQVRDMVEALGQGDLRHKAIQGVNAWLFYDGRNRPPAVRNDVRQYFDELLPADPVERVKFFASSFPAEFYDPDTAYCPADSTQQFDYAEGQMGGLAAQIAQSAALTQRAVATLSTGSAKNVTPFAHCLAQLVARPVSVFEEALVHAEGAAGSVDRQFFAGFLKGMDATHPESARDCLRSALRTKALRCQAVYLVGALRLTPDDIVLVASLVTSRELDPRQCAALAYGRAMDHLSTDAVAPLLEALQKLGPNGLWASLDVIVMLIHGGREVDQALIIPAWRALLSPDHFSSIGNMDPHHFESLVGRLARDGHIGASHARQLLKQITRLLQTTNGDARSSMHDSPKSVLKVLLSSYPEIVWEELAKVADRATPRLLGRMKELIGPPCGNDLEGGLLSELRPEWISDWVCGAPSRRASWPVTWLPVATKGAEGQLWWHPVIEAYVRQFHAVPGVLDELTVRLYPTSWSGSLVPYLTTFVDLLAAWANHPEPAIRAFANARRRQLLLEVKACGIREADDDIRLFG